jgi:hypothetical protein
MREGRIASVTRSTIHLAHTEQSVVSIISSHSIVESGTVNRIRASQPAVDDLSHDYLLTNVCCQEVQRLQYGKGSIGSRFVMDSMSRSYAKPCDLLTSCAVVPPALLQEQTTHNTRLIWS